MRQFSVLAASLVLACAVQAQEAAVQVAVDEAVSVHVIATAARLCGIISETGLVRATSRMDRVHATQLTPGQQETYLIFRGSDSFRNRVFASALRRAQGNCSDPELVAVWSDVNATLIQADLTSGLGGATRTLGGAPAQ